MEHTEMEQNPIDNDARRERRKRMLPQPACVICGISNVDQLVAVKVRLINPGALHLIDEHHLAGRENNPDLVVTVCLNHHAVLTAKNLDFGVSMKAPDTVLDRLVATMRGLAAFFILLGESLIDWAELLVRLIRGLDKNCAQWREMPEAKSHE
jgi:hypothetical protein